MASSGRKKASRKKPVAKKTSRKKPVAKETAQGDGSAGNDSGPIDVEIEGEAKYKLKSLHLEWEREDLRVRQAVQQQVSSLLARARRNDPAWLKANKARMDAVNALIDERTPELPEGYAITQVKLDEGTFRAAYGPEGRGKHVK